MPTLVAVALQPPSLDGLALRKVHAGVNLPFIYEADLVSTSAAAAAPQFQRHDALSSCYWPAAAPLADLVAQTTKEGERCLELGCGTGLCALTAATACGSSGHCLATDISQVSLDLTDAAAEAQQLRHIVETAILDSTDLEHVPLPAGYDVLILSDVFVTEALAKAYAARVAEACAAEASYRRVLVVDPGRSTRRTFLDELARRGVDSSPGFCSAEECLRRAASVPPEPGTLLLLLDTEEGAPMSYAI